MQQNQNINAQNILIEKGLIETLDPKQKNKHISYYKSGLVSHKITLIFLSLINFGLTIGAFTTLIKNNNEYILYSLDICKNNQNIPFISFWCDIGIYEINIINSHFVFIILFISFEFFTILVHKDITKLEIKGILYYLIIGIDSTFLIIFYIFIPLLFYLLAYSVIVLSTSPSEDFYLQENYITLESQKNWSQNKKDPIIHSVLLFLIFIFEMILLKIRGPILLYLNMKFEKSPRNKTKNASLEIGDQIVKFKVKTDKIIYLKSQQNKIYKFKEAKIEGRNGQIFIRLDNKSINNLFSFSNFDYPDLDETFLLLGKISEVIYGLLFVSIPLSKAHLNNEPNYILSKAVNMIIKSPLQFSQIFYYLGNYENSLNVSRIVLYCISLFIFLLFILKRIIFGGFGKHIYINITFYLVIIFIIENALYSILSLLCTLFSILSVIFYFDAVSIGNGNDMILPKLFIIMGLNFIIFWICIGLLSHSSKLCKIVYWLKNEIYNINNNNIDNNVILEPQFTYAGSDLNNYSLTEFPIQNCPRNVFYSRNIIKIVQINNIIKNNNTQLENNENDINLKVNIENNQINNQPSEEKNII